jgi:glutamate formiminotransferase
VDHISVLPLDNDDRKDHQIIKDTMTTTLTLTGWVAKEIGKSLNEIGADVLYYGYAHPSCTPLATVRRESTQFFASKSKNKNGSDDALTEHVTNSLGQVTVGAPEYFTENYNIRLRSSTPKNIAQSLTKHVREKDGGLLYLEALTLPYSHNRYEVACNLLNPNVTSTNSIDERIKSWKYFGENWIEASYRVGTTKEMCWNALKVVSTQDGEISYNQRVMKRFEEYIKQNG